MRSIILLTLALLTGCSATDNATMSEKKFIEIVEDISRAWNEGDAGRATQYFADDAVYEEPPGKQLFKGKRGIFEFFGGENGFDIPMRMAWQPRI